MKHFKEQDQTYIAGTYGRYDVELVSGKGAELTDVDGKTYIDLGSGIGVNTFGTADELWINAVTEQIGKLQHTSNLYYSEPSVKLAEALCKKSGMSKVFFCNSGAEANECAIKAVRKYYADHSCGKHSQIVTLENSFHGRTITTLAATGQAEFHTYFGPFTDGFVHVPANNCQAFAATVGEKTAAIIIEMVQGEGGVTNLTPKFVDCIKEAAEKFGFLIVVDEVQTGNGRTGKYFAYEHYGLKPDIVTTAKGLGGGLPIGAVLFSERTSGVFTPGTHGSTFGGNPVACAGALSIIGRIDEKLLDEVTAKGEYIKKFLHTVKGVTKVTGMGLMIGIETEKDAKMIAGRCVEKGVLVLTAKTKVRLLPPLNITYEQLDKALAVLKEVIEA